MFVACENSSFYKYYRHEGLLFKENKLCILSSSIQEILVREDHSGGLMGHFGVLKTLMSWVNIFTEQYEKGCGKNL